MSNNFQGLNSCRLSSAQGGEGANPVQDTITTTHALDANGNTTSYTYDTLDRRTKAILPDASERTWRYNRASETVGEVDPNSTAFTYDHDRLGRRTAVSVQTLGAGVIGTTGVVRTFEHDGLDRITEASDASANLGGTPGAQDVATDFLYDGPRCVEERSAADALRPNTYGCSLSPRFARCVPRHSALPGSLLVQLCICAVSPIAC